MHLKGPGFDWEAWVADLEADYVANPGAARTPLSGLCMQVSDLDESLDREQLWLHPVGGVRGVTVWQRDGGEVELSLPTGVSAADFDLAADLLRLGLKHGAEASSEEEEILRGGEEEMAAISREISRFNLEALVSHAAGTDELTLPVGGFLNLKITAADLSGERGTLEEILVERMGRYSSAFVATLMRMTNKADGRSSFVSNYGQMASLIDSRAELILTRGDDDPVCPEPIPAVRFYAVLDDRVEDLGQFKFVPAIDLKAEPETVAALTGSAGPPMSADADG